MRVAVISDSRRRGGAAMATARVFDALASQSDWTVRWFVSQDDGSQRVDTVVFTGPGVVRRSIQTLAGGRDPWRRRFVRVWAGYRNRRNLLRWMHRFQPDLISLHSVNEWSDAALHRTVVCDLTRIAPVVWTLHDMWPLTGDSDYPAEYCNPTLSDEQSFEQVFRDKAREREAANVAECAGRLVLAAPSEWIGRLAKRVYQEKLCVAHIPHGVSMTDFKPLPPMDCRLWLDIPADRPVVAAAATSLSAQRKGIDFLLKALAEMSRPVTVALFGHMRSDLTWPSHVRVVPLGFLDDARLLRAAYSAADVFVLPSLAEMFGLVLIESMACGTPCVGFETGGIPEIIRSGVTGYLAPRGDPIALAQAIERILQQSPEEKGTMRAACRRVAEQEYDLQIETRRYADLFAQLAGPDPGRSRPA